MADCLLLFRESPPETSVSRRYWRRRANHARAADLELTIGADGAVADARVVRGVLQLDEAALACARQWRYEPALIDGRVVPVIITASVTFP